MTAAVAKYLDGSEHQISVPIDVGGQYPVHVYLYANLLERPKVLMITEPGKTEFVPHYVEVPIALARLDEGV